MLGVPGKSRAQASWGYLGTDPLQDCPDFSIWHGYGTMAASLCCGLTLGAAKNATINSGGSRGSEGGGVQQRRRSAGAPSAAACRAGGVPPRAWEGRRGGGNSAGGPAPGHLLMGPPCPTTKFLHRDGRPNPPLAAPAPHAMVQCASGSAACLTQSSGRPGRCPQR